MELLVKNNILEKLQEIPVLADCEEEALQWIVDNSELRSYAIGDLVFKEGTPANYMFILLEGKCSFQVQRQGEWQEFGSITKGAITGILPFSRMKESGGNGIAMAETQIVALHKDHFPDLVCQSYKLTQKLVGEMTSRVRNFTTLQSQNEKLMSLGKMSAGLAHELNNPASAMVRSSEELYQRVHKTPERFKAVMAMKITPEETDSINAILFEKIDAAEKTPELSLMQREEALDELLDWLDDHDIDKGDDIAETFVDYNMTTADLDKILDSLHNKADTEAILWWLESTLSLEKLVNEMQEAAGRIESLVKSIKNYSHMDRGSARELINIHEGLKSTITILKHKFKKKNIQLDKNLDPNLPQIFAFGGELNQVFTNILDNAIDAMEHEGILTIKTYTEADHVFIEIGDNGKGIPEEELNKIFEPFFTTKAIGEGTGMGLDIVYKIIQKHRGAISVDSTVNVGTTFNIKLPLK